MHLITFDIDGTLVDSSGLDAMLYAQAIRDELGIQIDESWQSYRHVTDSGVLAEVLARHRPEQESLVLAERARERFISLVRQHVADRAKINAIPGAKALIRRLRAIPDVVVAIATGGWRESAEFKLDAVDIDYDGLPFASSSDAKSRLDIMRLAEQRASSDGVFDRKTYFGDAPWDQKASAELGYRFVAVGSGVDHPIRFDDLTDHGAILEALGV
jgi:beta-phosphoglucomutase-like phosphatase (HAD superfamily)